MDKFDEAIHLVKYCELEDYGIKASEMIRALPEDMNFNFEDLAVAAILNNILSSGLSALKVFKLFGDENVTNIVESISFCYEKNRPFREVLSNRLGKICPEGVLVYLYIIKATLLDNPTDEYISDIDYVLGHIWGNYNLFEIHKTVIKEIDAIIINKTKEK